LLKDSVTSHARNQLAFYWDGWRSINVIMVFLLLIILLLIFGNGIAAAVGIRYFVEKVAAVCVFPQFAELAVGVLGGFWV